MADYAAIPIAGGDTATPLSLQKRIRYVQSVICGAPLSILDCGCGAGDYVHHFFARFGWDAWGVEYSQEKVAQARRDNPSAERIRQGDLQQLDFPEATFDAALLNEVLEHVPDERRALREIHRVLRPGGQLILFSPNRWYPFETHGVYLGKTRRLLPPYVPFIPYVPVALGRRCFTYWARNYWQGELRALVRSQGFRIDRCDFFWQTFENISGRQPGFVRWVRPVLRAASTWLEGIPILRRFGVSQVVVARKAGPASKTGQGAAAISPAGGLSRENTA